MYKLFGAVQKSWPGLRTAAAINWILEDLPDDLPLNLWINQYQLYEADRAAKFVAGAPNRSVFLYHCIEPSGGGYLNTFVERPLMQTRLLQWLGAGRAADHVSGWLYYAVDAFATGCPANPSQHVPVRRLPGRAARTDWNAGNCIWSPKYNFWANGDGQLVYPAEEAGAFLPSVRLAATLDAMEDAELLRMLPAERRAALAARVVRNATHFNDGVPAAFEAARRAAAAEVVASLKFTW